ncbi:hypothetical protein HDU85_000795 [Gaertneriomyces sp. JEL0708]|nr:hypothetical protein HDU85_000795 [Gaertneriomyces sp. JEL0708]
MDDGLEEFTKVWLRERLGDHDYDTDSLVYWEKISLKDVPPKILQDCYDELDALFTGYKKHHCPHARRIVETIKSCIEMELRLRQRRRQLLQDFEKHFNKTMKLHFAFTQSRAFAHEGHLRNALLAAWSMKHPETPPLEDLPFRQLCDSSGEVIVEWDGMFRWNPTAPGKQTCEEDFIPSLVVLQSTSKIRGDFFLCEHKADTLCLRGKVETTLRRIYESMGSNSQSVEVRRTEPSAKVTQDAHLSLMMPDRLVVVLGCDSAPVYLEEAITDICATFTSRVASVEVMAVSPLGRFFDMRISSM